MLNRNKRYGRRSRSAWLRGQLSRRPKPVWVLVVTDVLLIIISLLVFALFHHVLPRKETSTGIVSSRYAAQVQTEGDDGEMPVLTGGAALEAPAATAAAAQVEPEQTATPEPTAEPALGDFSAKYPDLFTSGEIIRTDNSYQGPSVNIALNQYEYENSTFYLADIHIRDIECFRTAFAEDRFGRGVIEMPVDINRRAGGILAVNGDYYGAREDGVVIRNGELYRDKGLSMDVCVLYWDGTIKTFSSRAFDAQKAMMQGAYQAWHFGPSLLDENGQPLTSFSNASIGPKNPRTVLGYFEPGHYCFVVVDGRSAVSEGLTIKVLARLMSKLGCKQAYNMDGGATSMLVIGDRVINHPYNDGRPSSDIILIAEKP